MTDRQTSSVYEGRQPLPLDGRVERWAATGSPQTLAQREMVREWEATEQPSPATPPPEQGRRAR